VLVPERGNPCIELTELGGEDGVMSFGQTVQETGALLACPLDLGTDFGRCSHHMRKRATRIGHSLVLPVLAVAVLAGCAGDEEERWEVAYTALREDVPTRVVVVKDDGTDPRRVSGARFRANPALPRWSPDGSRIAFVRADPAGGPRAFDIYVVNADGSGERNLGDGSLPVWAKDGRSVVVERFHGPSESSTIHVIAVDGSGERRLARGSAPAISNSGSRVAFVRYTFRGSVTTSSSLYTISLNGTGLRLLARTTGRDVRWVQPQWLPGDSGVAVIQRIGSEVSSGPLLTFSTNGRRRVVARGVGETFDWSPRGDLVAYTAKNILYLVQPDGTEVDAHGQSNAIDIEWSPDGRMVAYSAIEGDESGQFVGLYLIDLEENERRRFVVSDGFAAYLDWRPKPPEDD
jgi:Tol biopolymer transport system component